MAFFDQTTQKHTQDINHRAPRVPIIPPRDGLRRYCLHGTAADCHRHVGTSRISLQRVENSQMQKKQRIGSGWRAISHSSSLVSLRWIGESRGGKGYNGKDGFSLSLSAVNSICTDGSTSRAKSLAAGNLGAGHIWDQQQQCRLLIDRTATSVATANENSTCLRKTYSLLCFGLPLYR